MAKNNFTVFGVEKEIYKAGDVERKELFKTGLEPDTTARSNDVNTALKETSLVTVGILNWVKDNTTGDFNTPNPDTSADNPVNTNAFLTKLTEALNSRITYLTAGKEATINTNNPLHGKIYTGSQTLAQLIATINSSITTVDGRVTALDSAKAQKATTLAGYGISDAYTKTQTNTEIAKKEPNITAGTTAQYWRGDKTWQALTKSVVGLGKVEDKSSATIRGELTSSNVTTALGFTPYNSTNPSAFTPLKIKVDGKTWLTGDVNLKAGSNVALSQDAGGNITIESSHITYTANKGIALAGTVFGHTNNITAGNTGNTTSSSPGYGGTFTVPYITYDANGHITGKDLRTITMPPAQSLGNGTLTLTNVAGASGYAVGVGRATGFSANTGTNYTYEITVGPSLSALATLMHSGSNGFIKKTGQNTYGIDTTSYLTGITSAHVLDALGYTPVNRAGVTNMTGTLEWTPLNGTASLDIIKAGMAGSDYFRIRVGATGTDEGFVEIATADNGTEPIYVRQYSGSSAFGTVSNEAILLDSNGNTRFPKKVYSSGKEVSTATFSRSGNNLTITR